MQIFVESKRRKLINVQRKHPGATIIDVTSKGMMPWLKFSPFYPHGGIPVPFSPHHRAQSVEGIWQGLKVFKSVDVDRSRFDITAMKGIKRTERRFGRTQGHRKGVNGELLLDYLTARLQIYLPSYKWVLEERLQAELSELRRLCQASTVVLLDYETNCDVQNLRKPLSHAGLMKAYLEATWPLDGKSETV